MEWQDICDFLSSETGEDIKRDFLRKSYPIFDWYNKAGCIIPPCKREDHGKTEYNDCGNEDIPSQARDIRKERIKLQTEKIEYNRWLRENARNELLIEKFVDKLTSLPPVRVPLRRVCQPNQRAGALLYGDAHVGSKFKICGLHGEILNEYNVGIFKDRMWRLLDQTVRICEKEGFDEINVFDVGDMTAGVLRASQLTQLELLSVDAACEYMQFISEWLNELTKYVNVNFQMTGGNHDQLRILGMPKNSFPQEDMSKIIRAYIKARLGDNPNFAFTENSTGMIFADIAGYHLLGIHGDVKNMEKAVKDFANVYHEKIDFLVGGHLHHYSAESVGYNVETIRVPSIVGIDTYSMSLNKSSNAGALFMIVEEGIGLTAQHFLHLN